MNRKDLFSLGVIWIVWINRSFGRWNSWANNLSDIDIKAPFPFIIVIGIIVSMLLTFIIRITQKKKEVLFSYLAVQAIIIVNMLLYYSTNSGYFYMLREEYNYALNFTILYLMSTVAMVMSIVNIRNATKEADENADKDTANNTETKTE